MKVALVHDYLNQYGGAEKVLESFTEIFPDAPIYTLIYDPELVKKILPNKEIRASFLQKIPFAVSRHRLFPPLMPIAVEKFDFSGFDLILSDSAAFSKGIITGPETLHICYCHTPTRYAWDDSHKYIREFNTPFWVKPFVPLFMNYLRLWDREAAFRVDKFISNSRFVAERIKKYYKSEAETIYPPVDTDNFFPGNKIEKYFLMVGRLLVYKRFDLAIDVFNELGFPLKIIGTGPEMTKLKKRANWNIEFLGNVDKEKMREYYQNCQALIFPQEEDFGIVALEAMACGRPVIAYRGGGALESVKEEETGIFFDEQKINSLLQVVKKFSSDNFDFRKIRAHAEKFDKKIFKEKIKDFIKKSYNEHRNRYKNSGQGN